MSGRPSPTWMAPLASRAIAAALSEPALALRRRWYRLRRELGRHPIRIEAFLAVDDPYSQLLASRLEGLSRAYDLGVRVHLVRSAESGDTRLDQRQRDYALRDAALLAQVLGDAVPLDVAPERRTALEALIARRWQRDEGADPATALSILRKVLLAADGGLDSAIATLRATDLERGRLAVRAGQERLQRLGHYQPGMLYFDGEWYWGVDRLHHLLERLDSEGTVADSTARTTLMRDIQALAAPARPTGALPEATTLDFYYSFRSPYSYLAADRTFALARRLGLTVRFKPVLPMVLRGLAVPRAKRLYILTDTAREARRYRIPFGRVTDPLPVAPALVALGLTAERLGLARPFVVAAGRAAWAEGRPLAAAGELERLAARAGLPRADTAATLANVDDLLEQAERNRNELYGEGLWGVPSFRIGDLAVWGQDRLGLLERIVTTERSE